MYRQPASALLASCTVMRSRGDALYSIQLLLNAIAMTVLSASATPFVVARMHDRTPPCEGMPWCDRKTRAFVRATTQYSRPYMP